MPIELRPMPSQVKRASIAVWLVYLIAILIGGIVVGFALPQLSATIDGRLYHDADQLWGIGDDMSAGLAPLLWDAYSVILGATIGALIVASFRDRRGWSGPLWLGTGLLFYFVMPAFRPQGELTLTGGINLMPFQVFHVAPTWFCEGMAVVGGLLSLVWLTLGLVRRLS